MSKRIFLLGHSSICFLPSGPYAGPLLFTGNLLGRFIVLGQAHAPCSNILFWALTPTIAPQNSGFSLPSKERKRVLTFLKDKFKRLFDLHVRERGFTCPINVTDVSQFTRHY